MTDARTGALGRGNRRSIDRLSADKSTPRRLAVAAKSPRSAPAMRPRMRRAMATKSMGGRMLRHPSSERAAHPSNHQVSSAVEPGARENLDKIAHGGIGHPRRPRSIPPDEGNF